MNLFRIVVLALVVLSSATLEARTSTSNHLIPINPDIYKKVVPDFRADIFESRMNDFFSSWGNLVVGYQVIVVRKDQIVASMAGGYADLDGNIPMTIAHKANIGSVMKFVTGALFVRLAEQHAAASGKTVDQVLDDKVINHLPVAFILRAHPSIWKLTFRDLLGHRSNFVTNSDFPYTYLADGIDESLHAMNNYDYQNANFSLLSYAIPGFRIPHAKNMAQITCGASVSCTRKLLGNWFEQLVRTELEDQFAMGPVRGSCYAPNHPVGLSESDFARNYVRAWAPGPGVIYDERKHLGHCHGAGGWHYSAEDLAALLINLESNAFFMSNAVFEDWAHPTWRSYQATRYVWPGSIGSDYFKNTFGWNALPFSGGDHYPGDADGGNAEAHAAIVKFPNDYYGIAIVNSGQPWQDGKPVWGSGNLGTALKNAVGETFKQMFP